MLGVSPGHRAAPPVEVTTRVAIDPIENALVALREVTKDYPGEPSAGLNRPGCFRVNIAASRRDRPGADHRLRPRRVRR